jgi:predicted Ser/Thr protein kinase
MEKKQFGRYTVTAELGRGAMGMVYRAEDPMIEREVAVKTLLPNLPSDQLEEVRGRFLREAKSAGRLNHPNIVTIYDVGEQDGVAYIAMEFLEGKSLQEILREGPRLAYDKMADLVAQVADALDHAHGFGIVHRDVKPANVMVQPNGRAKLADFGVARIQSSSMTQTGQALGSPKYMSPEQVLGQPADGRADVFSLGVVLYEMLAGRTPFERPGDTNVFALMHRIAGEPHAPVTSVDATIPRAFEEVLSKALAKNPDERFQRASQMAEALRRIVDPSRPPAPAQPASAEHEKTVRMPAASREPAATRTQLLADLDRFAQDFERQEQERLRAEEEARLRKEQELHRWAEEEAKRREEFERQKEAGTQTGARKAAALELLRKKAAERAAAVSNESARRGEIVARVDERLRAAFQYLSEFSKELNAAHPVSESPYGVLFLGEVPRAMLSDGFTDYRSREIEGKPRFDFVTFKFKASSVKPVTFTLAGKDMENFRERLERLKIKYEFAPKANDFGKVDRGAFTLTGPFPCGAIIRGDYDNSAILIGVENVRRYGARQGRLKIAEFTDDVLDEFGTYVLGADDAFEKRLAKP